MIPLRALRSIFSYTPLFYNNVTKLSKGIRLLNRLFGSFSIHNGRLATHAVRIVVTLLFSLRQDIFHRRIDANYRSMCEKFVTL